MDPRLGGLADRAVRLYEFLCAELGQGRTPSRRAMALRVGVSHTYLPRLLAALVRRDLIRLTPPPAAGRPGGIVLVEPRLLLHVEWESGLVTLHLGERTYRLALEEWRQLNTLVEAQVAAAWFGRGAG